MPIQLIHGDLKVIWMNVAAPRLDSHRRQLLDAVSEHPGPAFIDHQLARWDMPFPGAGAGTVNDIFQSLTFLL